MPDGIFDCYELDKLVSNFRVVWWLFFILFKFKRNICKQTMKNLIRQNAASNLGLHCLQMSHKKDAMLIYIYMEKSCTNINVGIILYFFL